MLAWNRPQHSITRVLLASTHLPCLPAVLITCILSVSRAHPRLNVLPLAWACPYPHAARLCCVVRLRTARVVHGRDAGNIDEEATSEERRAWQADVCTYTNTDTHTHT